MSFVALSPLPIAAALVALLTVVVAAASSVQHCPWGQCQDEEEVYMHLLQLHAKSNKGEAAPEAISGDDDSRTTLKNKYPFYHTSKEIRKSIELLSKDCGGAMTVETHSEDDVDIDVVHVRKPNSTPINKVFILFGEHSRELISPESGLHMLEVMCGKTTSDVSIPSILEDSEFQLVLNGNPSSRGKVEAGDYCLRTNPHGVDLNRNWDEKWVKPDGQDDYSQQNGGPRPFSEPETRIFRKLVEKFEPTTFLTVHSGTRGMYMPYAYDMEHLANFNAPRMMNILRDLDKNHCKCPFGAAGKEVGYPCPGTCLDWVYSKLRTPYVFAFEIYTSPSSDDELTARWNRKLAEGGTKLLQTGNHLGHNHFAELFDHHHSDFVHRRHKHSVETQQHRDSCFELFNPETEITYNSTVQNWAATYLEMAAMVAKELKKDNTSKTYF
jgi:hypothetical protein